MKKRSQYAALPYRVQGEDELHVLLVTSRETGRWVIPKGWPMKNRKPHRAATLEAFEEAGAIGVAEKRPIGTYEYAKRLEDGSALLCKVAVFPLAVESLASEWPEAGERERRWFEPNQAADQVDEPALAQMLREFAGVSGRAGVNGRGDR
ncbi:NUDIX domain-containing protein [Sphingomonas sp. ABOLD]|uniref:NUDIX hydrolase n=1 Tax=Sphingomonas sp. ABOLD TaxID=1985877 RepID=UPI000F7D639F|nr:NUDIX hydrolase [Sphingomonas sp. ABOLD]RSV45585.1 NUDIX domain-containing protein [Sphingomonas sp. ABOLD]